MRDDWLEIGAYQGRNEFWAEGYGAAFADFFLWLSEHGAEYIYQDAHPYAVVWRFPDAYAVLLKLRWSDYFVETGWDGLGGR